MPQLLRFAHRDAWFGLAIVGSIALFASIALSGRADGEPAATSLTTTNSPLLLTDGAQLVGQLTHLENGMLRGTFENPPSKARQLATGEWLKWGRPATIPRQPRVYLGPSSWLMIEPDWSSKLPCELTDRHLLFRHQLFGQVRLERQQADAILLQAANEANTAQKILREIYASDRSKDRLWLVGGDTLTGHISMASSQFQIRLGDEDVPIPAHQVAAIGFAKPQQEHLVTPPTTMLVGLGDGTQLAVTNVLLSGHHLAVTLHAKTQLEGSERDQLVFLQSLDPAIQYLSDLLPMDYLHTPYFGTTWPLETDFRQAHGPLVASGKRYPKGLAMHSAARAVYRVPPGATRFCAQVAIDDSAGTGGSVVARIYTATSNGLKQQWESPLLRGGDSPHSVRVNLNDAEAILLVVDYADAGDELDRVNWLDARFAP